jgi:hypothetical protein
MKGNKMSKLFDLNMIEAKKVVFLNPIFEDDFPDKGMKAWFTDIVKEEYCFKLYFDFTEFENENEKYFKANYYDKNNKPCLTAKQAGMYNPKYSVYFGDENMDEKELDTELKKYLKEV